MYNVNVLSVLDEKYNYKKHDYIGKYHFCSKHLKHKGALSALPYRFVSIYVTISAPMPLLISEHKTDVNTTVIMLDAMLSAPIFINEPVLPPDLNSRYQKPAVQANGTIKLTMRKNTLSLSRREYALSIPPIIPPARSSAQLIITPKKDRTIRSVCDSAYLLF